MQKVTDWNSETHELWYSIRTQAARWHYRYAPCTCSSNITVSVCNYLHVALLYICIPCPVKTVQLLFLQYLRFLLTGFNNFTVTIKMISGHTGCNGEKNVKKVQRKLNILQNKCETVFETHGGNTNLQKSCSSSLPNVPVVKLLYSCRTSVFHIVSHPGWLAEHLAVNHSDNNNIFTIINGWLAEHLAVNHSDNNTFTIIMTSWTSCCKPLW